MEDQGRRESRRKITYATGKVYAVCQEGGNSILGKDCRVDMCQNHEFLMPLIRKHENLSSPLIANPRANPEDSRGVLVMLQPLYWIQ